MAGSAGSAPDAAPPPLTRGGAPATVTRRLLARRRVQARLARVLAIVPLLLLCAGPLLFLALPLPLEPIRRRTYVDENALQPAQAELFWNWDEVKTADAVAEQVSQLALTAAANSSSRAEALRSLFASYGLTAHTQNYLYDVHPTLFRSTDRKRTTLAGSNTYALFRSPRTDGREAILITASWKSRWNGHDDPDGDTPSKLAARLAATGLAQDPQEGAAGTYELLKRKRVNVRGVASVVALSKYLSRWLHHSKDLIFVISDGHVDGMQAWASAYFGDDPASNAVIDPIHPSVLGRRIWTSLSLDYPSDSFSSLALLHEGTNAGAPNMDVLNTAVRVVQNLHGSSSIPIVLHGALPGAYDGRGENWVGDSREQSALLRRVLPSALVGLLERFVWRGEDGTAALVLAAKALLTQFRLMASGHPSGPHGVLHKYRVDAFTLFAVPARGPYGFYHIGRTVESTLRSFSNLVERLHHSQFFYLLADPWHFIQLPTYIVVPVLLGVAITIFGLRAWRYEGRESQRARERVARAFEVWLEQQEAAARRLVAPAPAPVSDEKAVQGPSTVGDDSLAEVEDLLDEEPASSQLRQRNVGTAPRRSERIRASATPEPSSHEPELAPPASTTNSPPLPARTIWVDIDPETPTRAQLQAHLEARTRRALARLSLSGKLGRSGSGVGVELARRVRAGLRAEDRPVGGALGLMAGAHVGAWLGGLGLVGRLDRCEGTGLWTCGVFRALHALSIGFPLLLTAFAYIYAARIEDSTADPTSALSPLALDTKVLPDKLPATPATPARAASESPRARLARLLHAFTLLYAGMLVSVLSVLNFALATGMGLLLAWPLCLSAVGGRRGRAEGEGEATAPSVPRTLRLLAELVVLLGALNPSLAFLVLARAGLVDAGALEAGLEAVWVGWRVWGNVTVPFVAVVYQAVVWQAAVGVLLSLLSW